MSYYVSNIFQYIERYFRKFFSKELSGWLRIIWFLGPVGIIAILGIVGLAIYVNPIPPKTVYIASGQEGSSHQKISQKFKNIFAKNNLTLELVPTKGLGDGFRSLNSQDSSVGASFYTVGSVTAANYPNLVSLGSVQYAPIWIFYRGAAVKTNDPFEYFSNKKISIGPKDNATNELFKKLYDLNQKTAMDPGNLLELSSKQGAERLIAGEIDAVFIVDNFESETVQKLLNADNIHIMSFPLADAYLKKLPFLQKLVIPKGSIKLDSVYPHEDVTILSTTVSLLVEKGTHPVIQWAYLLAAKEVGASFDTFFAPAGYFPKNLDSSFSLSPIAKRFYDQGTPVFFSYLPVTLASLVEQVWFYILALVLFILPAFNWLVSVRLSPAAWLMNRVFVDLRELDEALLTAETPDQILKIQEALEIYENEIYQTWLFGNNTRFYFNMKNALNGIKQQVRSKLEDLNRQAS